MIPSFRPTTPSVKFGSHIAWGTHIDSTGVFSSDKEYPPSKDYSNEIAAYAYEQTCIGRKVGVYFERPNGNGYNTYHLVYDDNKSKDLTKAIACKQPNLVVMEGLNFESTTFRR